MTQESQTQDARTEAHRLKGQGLKVKAIAAELAKGGWKSNRGTPYSPASIAQMLAKKEGAKSMPHKKAAAVKSAKPTDGNGKLQHVFTILIAEGLPDATKVELLKTYLR